MHRLTIPHKLDDKAHSGPKSRMFQRLRRVSTRGVVDDIRAREAVSFVSLFSSLPRRTHLKRIGWAQSGWGPAGARGLREQERHQTEKKQSSDDSRYCRAQLWTSVKHVQV